MPGTDHRSTASLEEDAYYYGYEVAGGNNPSVIEDHADSEEEALREIHQAFAQHTESALYANVVLPELRRMAGFEDTGPGTYTRAPSDDVQHRLDGLVSYYEDGYTDGLYHSTRWG